ncbi:MAG: hypothetical protein ABSH22_00835 [Tepidisphaeraceae bacterium]
MKHQKFEIPLGEPVRSLCWSGDLLMDWAGGNRVFHLGVPDTSRGRRVNWAYRFDAAVQSPSGRFAAIYERLGTKAIILDRGKMVREINRSFYHAHDYEFPIVLFNHPERGELIAHCPDCCAQIEIEEIATGNRLTKSPNRKPAEMFHSRLAVSPCQTELLSAGWVWHPLNMAWVWRIDEALADPSVLDSERQPSRACDCEISSAAFIDEQRILLTSSPKAEAFGNEKIPVFGPGHLAVFNLDSNIFETISRIDEPIGNMLWLGDGNIVSFYENPKVIEVKTGEVVFRWPDINTGKQDSSIIHHLGPPPPLAIDHVHKRFAVAAIDKITVIQFA